jgi:hypothetical protein
VPLPSFRRTKSEDEKTDAKLPLFSGSITPEGTYVERSNSPVHSQFTRIDVADRLFSVPLTGITSVPERDVSSVGFPWGSAAVSTRGDPPRGGAPSAGLCRSELLLAADRPFDAYLAVGLTVILDAQVERRLGSPSPRALGRPVREDY